MLKTLTVSCLLVTLQFTVTQQQHQPQQQYTTPVPILKQIDRHNDDGSYTYGYEAADKSFKIETKYPNGEVYGKYGYVDDQGNVREIEYGASKRGFEPAGSHINVPPPTINEKEPYPLGPNEIDDGQYREDPSIYYKDEKYNRPIAASKFSLNNYNQPQQNYYNAAPQHQPQPQPQPQPRQHYFNQQPIVPAPAPAPVPQPRYQQPAYQQPAYQQQPYYQQQAYQPQPPQPLYNPYNPNSLPNHFHPAVKALDIWSGSYSLDYTGRK